MLLRQSRRSFTEACVRSEFGAVGGRGWTNPFSTASPSELLLFLEAEKSESLSVRTYHNSRSRKKAKSHQVQKRRSMWIVKLALKRPYTFIVMALLILIASPVISLRTPTDIFPNINIPVIAAAWTFRDLNPEEMDVRFTAVFERVLTTWDTTSLPKFQQGSA
jgi:hypothetical protein